MLKKQKLKTVFLGSPDFAVPSLEATFRTSELMAIISQPDKPRGRGHDLLPTEVKAWGLNHGIPVFTPRSLKKPSDELDLLLTFLSNNKVDVGVVVAYGNLLPQSILDIPRLGCVNVHGSLLPKWRGAAPIQRSLEAGDPTTGVSLQKMVLELDAGDLISECEVPQDIDANAKQMWDLLSKHGANLLQGFLENDVQAQLLGAQIQNPNNVSLAPKILKNESLWTSQWTAAQFHNRTRAFLGWPTVRARMSTSGADAFEIKILQTRRMISRTDLPKLYPGELCVFEKRVLLGCSAVRTRELHENLHPSLVEVVRWQFPNKAPAEAHAYCQNLVGQKPSSSGQLGLRFLDP